MRIGRLTLAFALLLLPLVAAAQVPQVLRTPIEGATGTVDVGGQFTGTDGDEARYERYRDMRGGAYTNLSLNRVTDRFFFDAQASHIGYRDQRYNIEYMRPRFNFGFNWTSVPLNYSYIVRTPYVGDGATLTLPDSAQSAVQGPTNATNDGTAVGVPCAPGALPASCSNPGLADQAKANRSIYNDFAEPFELRTVRHTAALAANYATSSVDLDAKFTSTMKNGQQPWNASFAFNNAVEVPQPIDQNTNDVSLGASWSNARSMFRVGWDGSWFSNNNPVLTWDNPIRLTDFNNGITAFDCPSGGSGGPWDCSAYSNGNGPAQGREALAPNNMMNVFSVVSMYKLARYTTLNGTMQFTNQSQDDDLIPWTINPVIAQPATYVNFPNLAALPRATAEAEAQGVNALINLNHRFSRGVNAVVRYRYNKRDVQTPTFDASEYVRLDGTTSRSDHGLTPQFDNSRHLFDSNVSFSTSGGAVRIGYGRENAERHGRGFSDVGENIFRVSYDAYSSQFVTVRGNVDWGWRRGDGYVETGIDYEEGPGGTQPTLRYYDEADRDRTRGSIVVTVMPRDTVDVFFQFSGTKDKFLIDESAPVDRPDEHFGLQEQTNASWNFGANYHPTNMMSLGVNYGHDTFGSFQRSRNANPPPDPTWTDPSRDWTLDNDDSVNNFGLYADLTRPFKNTDIRFGYDYSDSANSFVHGGPRIDSLLAANQFIPLPDVENSWHRFSADVKYLFRARVGIGVGYYYETLDVIDFNTIDTNGPGGFAPATGDPRLDWLGGLTMGYGNRPYSGHTGSVRVVYQF